LLWGQLSWLAACETSIELSTFERLDEYCGLTTDFELRVRVSVCGTMWTVQDTVAREGQLAF